MEKVIKDGKVAILISPRYGSGWSSWNESRGLEKTLLFETTIVKMILRHSMDGVLLRSEKIIKYVSDKYPTAYTGGVYDLEVQWVDQGTEFLIREEDGYERVITPTKPHVA